MINNEDEKGINKDDTEVESEMEVDVEKEKDALNQKDIEIKELNNKLMRLQADFINFKKRAEKEKESSIAFGIESLVCELLPIIDNFQRALGSEEDKENILYKGISMIEQQLVTLLKNYSVEEIESKGKTFDPNFHHAVLMEESEEYESGMVSEVLQKGYSLKDKVIRPSMVKVSK